MSAPEGSPPPSHNQNSPGCSNCLGIPDNPFGRPRQFLDGDLIESSSESGDDQTIDTLSEFSESFQSGDESGDDASTSSELEANDSGQCSDADQNAGEEDEYDRIFNRGLGKSSCENSADEETDESDDNETKPKLITDTGPSTQQNDAARLESAIGKRRSDDKDPEDSQSKLRRL